MATNDGYSPYPLGLTAGEAVTAILKAHNLEASIDSILDAYGIGNLGEELNDKINFVESATIPTDAKAGTIWRDIDSNVLHIAYTDDVELVWFEV